MKPVEFLKLNNVNPSYQRLKILEYLMDNPTHPTADDIYAALIHELPTLSKTTVYNTLKLFKKKGITRSISIDDIENRFDANVHEHGHFKCEKCGNIYDFEISMDPSLQQELRGFKIHEKNYFFKGICKNCAEQ
ncbi:MAG: Fur family transcriptional regulator [Eubacteriales bacterium]